MSFVGLPMLATGEFPWLMWAVAALLAFAS